MGFKQNSAIYQFETFLREVIEDYKAVMRPDKTELLFPKTEFTVAFGKDYEKYFYNFRQQGGVIAYAVKHMGTEGMRNGVTAYMVTNKGAILEVRSTLKGGNEDTTSVRVIAEAGWQGVRTMVEMNGMLYLSDYKYIWYLDPKDESNRGNYRHGYSDVHFRRIEHIAAIPQDKALVFVKDGGLWYMLPNKHPKDEPLDPEVGVLEKTGWDHINKVCSMDGYMYIAETRKVISGVPATTNLRPGQIWMVYPDKNWHDYLRFADDKRWDGVQFMSGVNGLLFVGWKDELYVIQPKMPPEISPFKKIRDASLTQLQYMGTCGCNLYFQFFPE